MGKHTPGPWEARMQENTRGEPAGWIVEQVDGPDRRGGRIGWASLAWADTNEGAPPDHPECTANATRIVSCVNACEGIEDPSVVPELLEAAKAIMSKYHTPDTYDDAAEALRAAIAKAEGGAS